MAVVLWEEKEGYRKEILKGDPQIFLPIHVIYPSQGGQHPADLSCSGIPKASFMLWNERKQKAKNNEQILNLIPYRFQFPEIQFTHLGTENENLKFKEIYTKFK